MARCPFAVWHPISGSSGSHLGGPFKIVHHTTEGSTAKGAINAFAQNRSDPHFTVDETTIFQHIDTNEGARSLRNDDGGVQTNRDSAVQIELVGFAHLSKNRRALTNVARLCRWIEATHGVPRIWPSGLPRPAKNGRDPGGHNRNAETWDGQGGHYGHCHVPENTHWDPGYTAHEVSFVMDAVFDAAGRLLTRSPIPQPRTRTRNTGAPATTMPDHGVVPVGVAAYVRDLPLSPPSVVAKTPTRRVHAARKTVRLRTSARATAAVATVDLGALLAFVQGVSAQDKQDVLDSLQLAQRAASGTFDRFMQTEFWYRRFIEVLQNLGWANEQLRFTRLEQAGGEIAMRRAALGVLSTVASQDQTAVLEHAIERLSTLADDDKRIRLLNAHALQQTSGNLQLGVVQRDASDALTVTLGALYFHCLDVRDRLLFASWQPRAINLWTAAQRMTLNTGLYARRRKGVVAKLGPDATQYVAELKLRMS